MIRGVKPPFGGLRLECMLSSRFGNSDKKGFESCNDSQGSITSDRASTHDLSEQKGILEVCPPDPERREISSPRAAIETDFLPMIAAVHDFKTPWVVMLGYTDALHRGDLGPLNSKQRQRYSAFGLTSGARATVTTGSPCSSRRTAASLNSLVNNLRGAPRSFTSSLTAVMSKASVNAAISHLVERQADGGGNGCT